MMQITTYRETYHEPTRMIEVPEALQSEGFEVYFMPLSVPKQTEKQSKQQTEQPTQNSKVGFGDKIASYFTDVPAPSCAEEELVIPPRANNRQAVSFL